MIRCSRCRREASIDLIVCPHCGRNLAPAGPRWALWIPLALILALVAYRGWYWLPIEKAKEQAVAAQSRLSNLMKLPELGTPTAATVVSRNPATPTPSPTRTSTATATRPPSATPSPAPTATTGAREYVVQAGDSLALIGQKLDIPWETIAALNGLTGYSMLQPGDKLKVPTPTPAPTRATATVALTATPTQAISPTPAATGTPSAQPPSSGTALATAAPTSAATPTAVLATATAMPATATARPLPTSTPTPALAVLTLINPGNGSNYDGENAQIMLEWQNKDYLPAGAVYRVTIRWVEKGTPMSSVQDTTAPSCRAPLWLWGKADQPSRQYTWSVQIVQLATDGKGGERVIELNPPSEVRTLYWK